MPINLHTPKDILRLGNPSKIRGMPRITDMDIAAPARTPIPTLRIRSARTISTRLFATTIHRPAPALRLLRKERAAGAEVRAGGGGVCLRLGDHVGVFVRVGAQHGVQDVHEFGVFTERVRGWGNFGGGADGERGGWRAGVKESEEVVAEGALVGEDVLRW